MPPKRDPVTEVEELPDIEPEGEDGLESCFTVGPGDLPPLQAEPEEDDELPPRITTCG